MNLDSRILHLMVTQVFNPRSGNFTTATHEEMWIMYSIIEENPPDLLGLTMRKMHEGVNWSKRESNNNGVPYGKLVTKICKGVATFSSDELIETNIMAAINKGSLKRMDFIHDKDTDTWVKIRKEEAQEITMASIMEAMKNMVSRVDTRFERGLRLKYVNDNVEDMRCLQNFDPYSEPYPFPEPFPPFDPSQDP